MVLTGACTTFAVVSLRSSLGFSASNNSLHTHLGGSHGQELAICEAKTYIAMARIIALD